MRLFKLTKSFAKLTHSAIFPLHKSSLVPVGLILLGVVFWFSALPFKQELQAFNFDLYQQVAPRERISAPVVIVDIDESSLEKLGQWPWPRSLIAELLGTIGKHNPAAVGVDILFTEQDRSSPCAAVREMVNVTADAIDQICAQPSNDALLAQQLFQLPSVVAVAGVEGGNAQPLDVTPVIVNGPSPEKIRGFSGSLSNIPAVHQAASGWGLVSTEMDRGVIRKTPLVAAVNGQYIPALSVEMVRLATGAKEIVLNSVDGGVSTLTIGGLSIPTEPDGSTFIHYSPHDVKRFVSAIDLLEGRIDPQLLAQRFVLVGISGLGLVDYVSTPLSERLPGVEVHAQVLETLFDETLLQVPSWSVPLQTGLVLLLSVLVVYLIPRFRIALQLPIFFGVFGLVCFAGFYQFQQQLLLIDIASPLVVYSVLYFALLADTLLTGEKKIDDLEFKVRERTKRMMELQDVAMEAMGALAESRDPETGNHIRRTQNYVRLLAEVLSKEEKYAAQLTPTVITHLYKTAPLHDIGKVGIPDEILLKPGKLTDDEFVIMKRHPEYGKRAIEAAERKMEEPSEFLRYAKEIIYGHHEKWDGSGYPLGLAGVAIPLSARLMAIADVYDALICRRCYKPPFPHEKAVGIIVEGRGTHFDPELVDKFLEISDDFYQIALQFEDKEEDFEQA